MKVIDVIVKRIFSDFVKDSDRLIDNATLCGDLNLNRDNLKNIWNRIEVVLSLKIPEEIFMNKTTYGEIREFIQLVYFQVTQEMIASTN